MGLSASIDTVQMTINNFSASVNMADMLMALLRYNTDNLIKNHQYSVTPSYPDQTQKYSSLVGSIRNPLAGYGDSTDENTHGRGGFCKYNIVQNPVGDGTPKTAIVDIVFTEPLFILSPAYWGGKETHPFINVNTLDFNFTFLNQAANRYWSRDETSVPLTSLQSTIATLINSGPAFSFPETQPTLQFTYITPQETQIIPRDMMSVYPYWEIQRFPTDTSLYAPGEQRMISSNNIQISNIPQRIYIFARKKNQDLYSDVTATDTFLAINKVSIQYYNKTGLLNSASQQQLYQISVRNGCSLSYSAWTGGQVYLPGSLTQKYGLHGSVLCISPAMDLGLNDLQSSGKIDHNTFQIDVTLTNVSSDAITPTLYVVMVNEGVFTVGPGVGQASGQVGVLSSQDILDAHAKPGIDYYDIKDVNGGDFLGDVKSFFSDKVLPLIKQSRIASNLANMIPFAGPAISKSIRNLGYGEDYEGDGVLFDEDEAYAGDGVMGGRSMSRKSLRSNARRKIVL